MEVVNKLFDQSADYLPRLERDLDAAVRTVIPNHGTLLDVLQLFTDGALRGRYQTAVTDPAVGEYWDYFARLGREAERARQVEVTVNRLYRLLVPRLIRRIVDTATTTVLFEAVLADAPLRGADLTDVRLDGADLTTAKNLTPQQLESAQGDDQTTLPAGLQRPAHWSTSPAAPPGR